MTRQRLLVAAVLVVLVVATLLFLGVGGEPADTLQIANEREDTSVVEVYQVDADATVVLERADGTTTTAQPSDVGSLANVTTVRVPANTSREAIPVFPNGTASANASETGSRFVYVVHDGDPDGRTYFAVGLVDCGDDTAAASITITDGDATLAANPCE